MAILTGVPRRFNQWLEDQREDREREPFSTRHLACVAVSMFHINCILKGPIPTKDDYLGYDWVALMKAENHGDDNDE